MIAYNCYYCKKYNYCDKRKTLLHENLAFFPNSATKRNICYVADTKKVYKRGEIKIKEKRKRRRKK